MNARLAYIGLLLISGAGYVWMGYGIDRADFYSLAACFGLLFICYFLLLRSRFQWRWKRLFWIAMALRCTQLLVTPPLSDDYHRFLWDGNMIVQGENPYVILPQEYVRSHPDPELIRLEEAMNSPGYFTIYPPVSQGFFAVAAWLSGGQTELGVYILRILLLLMEGVLLWCLPAVMRAFRIKPQQMAWYALNPLVIIEVSGNLHFEAVVLTFMALGLLAYLKHKWGWAAFFSALAISTKLLPVLLLPMLWKPLANKRWIFYGLTAAFTLLTFVPFISADLWEHWSQSLDLFFRSFEFNASVYYLLREAGYVVYGYNPIQLLGPVLSAVALITILWVSWKRRGTVAHRPVWIYAIYLFCATTVHPWYVVTLCGLGLLTTQRWMYIWSLLIPLSYVHYIGGGFTENYAFIAVEYGLLLAFILLERRPQVQLALNRWFNGYP